MKVKELIEELKKQPQEATILFSESEGPTERDIEFKEKTYDGELCLIL